MCPCRPEREPLELSSESHYGLIVSTKCSLRIDAGDATGQIRTLRALKQERGTGSQLSACTAFILSCAKSAGFTFFHSTLGG
jgi:hypothetical protein